MEKLGLMNWPNEKCLQKTTCCTGLDLQFSHAYHASSVGVGVEEHCLNPWKGSRISGTINGCETECYSIIVTEL